jgi:hypothetical protein
MDMDMGMGMGILRRARGSAVLIDMLRNSASGPKKGSLVRSAGVAGVAGVAMRVATSRRLRGCSGEWSGWKMDDE